MHIKNRRKKIIIHSLQIQLIIAIFGLIVSISVILVTSLFLIFKNNIFEASITEEIAKQIVSNSILPVVIIGIVLFIMSLWTIIMITHKIYGPLHRLRTYIKKLSDGEIPDALEFRKGDAIDGLREIYNDLRLSLEKILHYDYGAMVKIFSELQDILDKMYKKKTYDHQLYDSLQKVCSKLAKALDITSEVIESEKS